jgi:DNA-binding HxlR family transcriptional regulator
MNRSYQQDCPVARAMDIIGERWAPLILRDLLLHKSRRFQDFQEALPGIAPNTLSERLKALEGHGIIARRQYEDHPPRFEYVLSDKGKTLGPIIKALRDWGARHT